MSLRTFITAVFCLFILALSSGLGRTIVRTQNHFPSYVGTAFAEGDMPAPDANDGGAPAGAASSSGGGGGGGGQPFGYLRVSTWALGDQTWGGMIGSIIRTFAGSMVYVSGAVFILGALFFALSGTKEDWKSWGKTMMIQSLVALAVVLGSVSILRAVFFFVWG
ncbi:MAG: hypothetical protein PHS73_05050 [Candidatus Peribacteraceae bacterium]|nr:hypothetical protein [Candidatus Peribacteraceae bacterium]